MKEGEQNKFKDNLDEIFDKLDKKNNGKTWKISSANINNYLYSHNIQEINEKSLYDWFGDNIYNMISDGYYLTHILGFTPQPLEKIYKAYEAAFSYLSPNLGCNGLNSFQIFIMYYTYNFCYTDAQKRMFTYLKKQNLHNKIILEFYNLHRKYGLDPNYTDTNCFSNTDFIAAYSLFFDGANFDDVKRTIELLNNIIDIDKTLNMARSCDILEGCMYSPYNFTRKEIDGKNSLFFRIMKYWKFNTYRNVSFEDINSPDEILSAIEELRIKGEECNEFAAKQNCENIKRVLKIN